MRCVAVLGCLQWAQSEGWCTEDEHLWEEAVAEGAQRDKAGEAACDSVKLTGCERGSDKPDAERIDATVTKRCKMRRNSPAFASEHQRRQVFLCQRIDHAFGELAFLHGLDSSAADGRLRLSPLIMSLGFFK